MNYLFMCMKRSGQHGVLNWFAQQANHDVLHYNNCINGWGTTRLLPMKEHMMVHYRYNGAEHEVKNYFVDHKIDFTASEALRKEFYDADFSEVVDNIYNIEDLTFDDYNRLRMWDFEEMKDGGKTVLIVRDPFNFVASCLQRLKNPPDAGATDVGTQLPTRIKEWKRHARQALNADESSQPIEIINFNEWFASEEYRRQICVRLGLEFTDRGLNKVMNFGSGSSFDREKFDGNAQRMKVLTRYLEWKDHAAFKHLVDDEIVDLARDLFGIKI
jgi:hypothetical protein